MNFIYLCLALVGIGAGCVMLAAGPGLHWLGASAVLVGAAFLALGTGGFRRGGPTAPEAAIRDPFTAADFYSPNVVLPPPGRVSIYCLHPQIDADLDRESFVIGYGDYLSPISITDDPWQLTRGELLALAPERRPVEVGGQVGGVIEHRVGRKIGVRPPAAP